jgi:hypothetical protein
MDGGIGQVGVGVIHNSALDHPWFSGLSLFTTHLIYFPELLAHMSLSCELDRLNRLVCITRYGLNVVMKYDVACSSFAFYYLVGLSLD